MENICQVLVLESTVSITLEPKNDKVSKENALQTVEIIILIEGPSLNILWRDEVLVGCLFEILDRDLCRRISLNSKEPG